MLDPVDGLDALGDRGASSKEPNHLFVDTALVRALAGDLATTPEWQAGFDAMLGYAESKGWMHPSGAMIHAHLTEPPN